MTNNMSGVDQGLNNHCVSNFAGLEALFRPRKAIFRIGFYHHNVADLTK